MKTAANWQLFSCALTSLRGYTVEYMSVLLVALYAVFGLIVGSFLNVVILRYNTGHSIGGRSSCLSCSHALSWYDLVPLFSYMWLRGRCQYCKSALSIQYPFVEATAALLFGLVAWTTVADFTLASLLASAFDLIVITLLIVIGAYDIRHTIIPDGPVYTLIALSFAGLFYSEFVIATPALPALLAGPLAALPLALLWLISHGRWMGLGDAKLALGLGWLLGLSGAFSMLLLSFWIGAVVSVLLLLVARAMHEWQLFRALRHLTMKSEIAFGPFLIVAYLLVYFLDINVTSLFLL